MRRAIAATIMVLSSLEPLHSAPGQDPEFDRGIELVRQGEYGQAIIVLDPVVRRLDAQPAAKKQAALAYLNLGIAYVGEGQETLARSSFRQAAQRDATLQLTAFDVSPKVRELFEKAREDVRQEALAKAPPPQNKGGGGGKVLLLVGVLGAGGAAAALAGGGGGDGGGGGGGGDGSRTIAVQGPQCQDVANTCVHIVGIAVTFSTGSGSSVSWDFGDGTTGSGTSTTHTYQAAGTFNVSAVTEGATVRTSVTVRSMAGTWDADAGGERFVVQIQQSGATVTGDADGQSFTGSVGSGRNINIVPNCGTSTSQFQIDSTGNTLGPAAGFLPCRRQGPITTTMTRR